MIYFLFQPKLERDAVFLEEYEIISNTEWKVLNLLNIKTLLHTHLFQEMVHDRTIKYIQRWTVGHINNNLEVTRHTYVLIIMYYDNKGKIYLFSTRLDRLCHCKKIQRHSYEIVFDCILLFWPTRWLSWQSESLFSWRWLLSWLSFDYSDHSGYPIYLGYYLDFAAYYPNFP